MTEFWIIVQTVAAVVTAIAAAGAFAYVRRGIRTLREHDRVLYGEEAVEGWDGIVAIVQNNRERSRRNRECLDSLKNDPDR